MFLQLSAAGCATVKLNLEMQRALTNSSKLYVLHYTCFMQSVISLPTYILSLNKEMLESYLFKIINSSVEAQVIHICKVNKVLIKQVLSICFPFYPCIELLVIMAA